MLQGEEGSARRATLLHTIPPAWTNLLVAEFLSFPPILMVRCTMMESPYTEWR